MKIIKWSVLASFLLAIYLGNIADILKSKRSVGSLFVTSSIPVSLLNT